MAPSHYLKQCGLIIKLINKVLWHLSQGIITKDLKIPISKMRLKLVCWDNFTPSPKINNSFSSDFVCHGGKLSSIVTIFNPSGLCLFKGNKEHVSFVTTPQGGNVPRTYLLHEESVTWKIMTSSVKAKIWKWLTAVAIAKKNQFRFSIPIPIPIQGFSIPIPFSIPPISIPIPILELELTCNSNSGIELTPTLLVISLTFPS